LLGCIGAHLQGGNFGDILLGAGVGALFGAICPWGAFGSLAGSFGFAGAAYLAGGNRDTIATAWDWGGLIGGVAGSVPYGLKAVIPELGGGLFGAGLGLYASGGDWDAALMGASFGMIVGGIGGSFASHLVSRNSLALSRSRFGSGGMTPLAWPWEWGTTRSTIARMRKEGFEVLPWDATVGLTRTGRIRVSIDPWYSPTVVVEEYLHAKTLQTIIRRQGVDAARRFLDDPILNYTDELVLKAFLIRQAKLGLPGGKTIRLDLASLWRTRSQYEQLLLQEQRYLKP
jgi:hypothetical protein